MRCPSFDRELFASGISSPGRYQVDEPPLAGVIPHHLIASDLIAGFLAACAAYGDEYDGVLLLSPSHFPENCTSDVVTSTADWETPVGNVNTDRETVRALLENAGIAAEDNPAAVEADHGVSGILPFLRHYLPDKEVAVCLLANRLSRQRLEEVQTAVNRLCADRRILLIASLDCSHYLQPEEAARMDLETAAAIEAFDLERILGFTDSHVDSPQALTTFLSRALDGGLELRQLDHTSSAQILPHAISNPVYLEGVTSYYVYAAVAP